MTDTTRTCGAPTKAGTLCKCSMNISATSGLCMMHDPERKAERAAIHRAGGSASGVARTRAKAADPATVPPAPKTIEDAEKFASWLTHTVCSGGIDSRTAHEAAVCLREFRGAAEKRIMERAIKALRAELAAARKDAPTVKSRG